MDISYFINILAGLVAVCFVLAPHEWGHAFVATKCGDGTPRAYGRLTLNPIKHLDPVGFICCALVGFGWAKPVPINPMNFKDYKKGLFLTAVAGVVVNYIIAFAVYLLYVLFVRYACDAMIGTDAGAYFAYFISCTLGNIFSFSLCVFVFNLLPLYPLDGFRVVESLTRQVNPVRRFLREYGQMILIILIGESFICNLMLRYGVSWAGYCDILGYVMQFATEIVGFPIHAAWDWILAL